MNSSVKRILANGVEIPSIGYGPGILAQSFPRRRIRKGLLNYYDRAFNKFVQVPYNKYKYKQGIISAFNLGYRLLDYSSTYGNLDLIKKAITLSGLERNKLFLTVRISNNTKKNHTVKEDVLSAISQMGIGYADLLQFHWPVTGFYIDTWKEMISLYQEGVCRSIGVANCNIHHLQALERATGIKSMLNQFEIHPLFTQKELVSYCHDNDIVIEAYTPTARYDDRLVNLPALKKIANNHNKDIIQVILRWHCQNGIIPIVRSFNNAHQKSNIDIFDFLLSDEEMKIIDSFNINSRLRYDPDNCDFSIL